METEILVIKSKRGDKDALVQLIMAQKQEYYKLAYVYMQNKEEALDAMEDMILVLYQSIGKLKQNSSFYSWSKTILVNCCKASLKKRSKTTVWEELEESQEQMIQQKEEQLAVEQYLSQLSPKHEEILRLRYFMDLEYQAIADMLKLPLGTVKSRISAGLNKLKTLMGGEGL